jgi:hypothetical protein
MSNEVLIYFFIDHMHLTMLLIVLSPCLILILVALAAYFIRATQAVAFVLLTYWARCVQASTEGFAIAVVIVIILLFIWAIACHPIDPWPGKTAAEEPNK